MKILHIVRMYHPSIGGNQIHIKELSEKLVEFGHNVAVFTSYALNESHINKPPNKRINIPRKEPINGVLVDRLTINYRLRSLLFKILPEIHGGYRLTNIIFKNAYELLRQGPFIPKIIFKILKFRPDVVLATSFWGSQALYCYIAKKIIKFHLVVIPCMHIGRKWANNPFIYKIMRSADLIIALTKFEKDFLIKKGMDREKISVIGVGVNPYKFKSSNKDTFRSKYRIHKNPVIAFVGRKWNYKGIDTLIDAMRIVWKRQPEARLVLAGSKTADESCIKNKILSLNESEQKNIISINDFSEDFKSEIFNSCDIFALPSKFESFGIVYIEAWMHKKPVIGCKNCPPATVIDDGENGLLTEYGNKEDLADAILKLLNNEQMRIRFGESGRKKVLNNYTWDIIANKIRQKYYDLVKLNK